MRLRRSVPPLDIFGFFGLRSVALSRGQPLSENLLRETNENHLTFVVVVSSCETKTNRKGIDFHKIKRKKSVFY
jgi:hypothetical protein